MQFHTRAGAVVFALATLSCASGRPGYRAEAGAVPPLAVAQGSQCGFGPLPDSIVELNSIVDSAALATLLKASAAAPAIIAAVHFTAGGTIQSVRALTPPRDSALTLALAAGLRATLRPLPKGSLWGIRILARGGPSPQMELFRSEYCPPRPLGVGGIEAVVLPLNDNQLAASFGSSRMEILIDAQGNPSHVRIVLSSGNSAMDAFHMSIVRSRQYEPARLDGEAVPGWLITNWMHS